MKRKIVFALVLILCAAAVWRFYSIEKIEYGRYTSSDGHAWVELWGNKTFILSLDPLTSYHPEGTFVIKDKQVILTDNSKRNYIFTIEGKKLIYKQSEGDGGTVRTGMPFELSEDRKVGF